MGGEGNTPLIDENFAHVALVVASRTDIHWHHVYLCDGNDTSDTDASDCGGGKGLLMEKHAELVFTCGGNHSTFHLTLDSPVSHHSTDPEVIRKRKHYFLALLYLLQNTTTQSKLQKLIHTSKILYNK